jgi:uncharacterized protein
VKYEGNYSVKFVLETGLNVLIHGYEIGKISITGINGDHPDIQSGLVDEWDGDNHLGIIKKSITIRASGEIKSWEPQTISEFNPKHFLNFSDGQPEVILFGTGKQLTFPPQDCLSVIQQLNLGYEVMDTAAACRTFNVLAAEGRDVILAVLMIEG